MSSLALKPGIALASGPCRRRAGILPLCAAVIMGWVCQAIWFTLAFFTFNYSPAWSILIGASTVAFGGFLAMMSRSLYCDMHKQYLIEVNATEVVLTVSDKIRARETVTMVLVEDVAHGEWYADTSTLILHTSYKSLELPLWSLGSRGTDILYFLHGSGIKIVNVLLDDSMPE